MAIPIASIGSLPATLEPSAQGATGTAPATGTATQGGDLFGALLAAESAPATDETTGTAFLELTTDLTAALATDPPTDAGALTGLLAFAAQILNIPTNAAVAQANGEATAAAPLAQLPTDSRTRADQLVLDTANLPTVPAAPQPAPPAVQVAASVEASAVPVPGTEPDEPSAAELADRTALSPRTGTPNVVAQPPLITIGAPVPPAPPALNEITPPVAEPVASVPTSALPDATLGARPSTAGEQYAALASAGERLAAQVEVAPTEPQREIAPTTFVAATRDALAVAPTTPTAVTAPQPNTDLAPTATTPAVRPVADEDGIIELPPAIPQAPVTTNSPTARISFPAARGGIPVAAPAVVPESDVAQSALVIASAGASARLAPRGEFAPTDEPADVVATGVPSVAFAPPAPERVSTAPAPAAPAPVAPPPVADQLAGALVSRAEVAQRDGSTEFQMRLDPPELGRMQVKLIANGDELRGQVLVADDTVKRLLESQLPELRHKLEAAGVTVQTLDVATDPNGGRGSFRDERDDRPAFAARIPRDPEPPRRPRPAPVAARVGALDVTV